jgi:hypothetical protein
MVEFPFYHFLLHLEFQMNRSSIYMSAVLVTS